MLRNFGIKNSPGKKRETHSMTGESVPQATGTGQKLDRVFTYNLNPGMIGRVIQETTLDS